MRHDVRRIRVAEAAERPGAAGQRPEGSLQKTAEATDKSDSVTVAMSGTAGGEKISMKGVLDLGDPVKAEMTTTDAKGDATVVRMVGAVIYVEIPAEDRAEMDGKRWMKMDLSAAGKQAGMDFGKQFEDIDPTKQVKTLLATEGTKVVGQETVNGRPPSTTPSPRRWRPTFSRSTRSCGRASSSR
ncbi:hypothetical protein NKG94_26240 [Micromonospora sp. M12]